VVYKPINGEITQMVLWESDKLIVAMKSRNWDGAKGLTEEPLDRGHFLQTLNWKLMEVNKTRTKTCL